MHGPNLNEFNYKQLILMAFNNPNYDNIITTIINK